MVRQKSELLSWVGVVFEIVKAIVDEVLDLGGNDDDVRKILKDGSIRKEIAKLLVQSKSAITATFRVLVDYGKSLAEMVAVGKYDWVNNDITKDHFPIKGNGQKEVEVVLFHFNKVMSTDQVLAEMAKAGFHPASIEELLALGASQPELQRQFPIVAMGSVWRHPDGDRRVPYLCRGDARRYLRLGWLEGDWYEGYRFAAVRNA